MGRRAVVVPFVSLALAVLVLAAPAPAVAQPATPSAAPAAVESLFVTPQEAFPPAPVPAALARITFDPDAGHFMNANPGPALHYVEEGGFTVLAGDAMTVSRAATAGTPAPPESVALGTEFTIGPGDLLVIPANAPFEVFNTGTTPAVALIVEFFGRPPGAALPPGIVLEPLVVGGMTALPAGPVDVELVRRTLEPGAEVPPALSDAMTLTHVEAGTAGYTLEQGAGQVSTAATPDAAPEELSPATPGAESLVGTGGMIVDQSGTMSALRNAGDDPLVLLTLSVVPTAASAGTPESATSAPQ